MIPARRWPIFNRVFVAYARHLLRRQFAEVYLEGAEVARAELAERPMVFVSNHTSWWDSIVLMWVSNYIFSRKWSAYALMDAKNMRRVPFFRYLGAFGVDLSRPEERQASIGYAAGLLKKRGDHCWVFPQGAERPVTEALEFRSGSSRISEAAGVRIVPMALRYEFGRTPKPTAFVYFGEPLPSGASPDVQAAAVARLLAQIEERVRSRSRTRDHERPALWGYRSPLGVLAKRVLGALSRRS